MSLTGVKEFGDRMRKKSLEVSWPLDGSVEHIATVSASLPHVVHGVRNGCSFLTYKAGSRRQVCGYKLGD